MAEYNLNEDLLIDPEALDVELMRQPMLYGKYAKIAARAQEAAKRAEENVKVVRSELIKNFLSAAEGGKSPTAQVLEAMYRTHPDHVEAKEEWLEATQEAELTQQALWAVKARGESLENLVKLAAMQYFAMPDVPRNLGKEWAERVEDRRQDAIRQKVADHQPGRRGRTR